MKLHYHPRGTFRHIASNIRIPRFCTSSVTPDKATLLACKEELDSVEVDLGSLFFAIQDIYFEHCLIDEFRYSRMSHLLLEDGFSITEDHLLQIKDLLFFTICASNAPEIEYEFLMKMINKISSDLEIEFVMNLLVLRGADVFSRFCLSIGRRK